jgi:magnesium-transporting ATPase (P-type)
MKQKTNNNENSNRILFFGRDARTKNKSYKYPPNYIKTSKYNILTFLPLSLMSQFTRYANIYFLVTAILNCFPIISTLNPISAIAPLVFVIALSMLREGMEDYQRHKSDTELNSSKCYILDGHLFLQRTWKEVEIG